MRLRRTSASLAVFCYGASASFAPGVDSSALTPPPEEDVVIVGGGIVGLSAAVALSRRCSDNGCGPRLKLKVYERSRALRPVGALFGLFPNGAAALRSVCPRVHRLALEGAIPVAGGIHKDVRGGEVVSVRQTDSGGLDRAETAGRGAFLAWYLLQRHLAEALPDGTLLLGKEFEAYEVDDRTGLVRVRLADRETGAAETVTCRVLIGADGIRSSVRARMLGRDAPLRYHGRVMYRGVLDADRAAEESVPPRGYRTYYACGEPGKGFAFGEVARGVLAFTATVIAEAPPPEDRLRVKDRMRAVFGEYPPDVRQLIDAVDAPAIHENAVCDIDMLDSWSSGPVLLIGDAAHSMTPALGQGGNIGLEDSAVLALCLAPALIDIVSAGAEGEESREALGRQQREISASLEQYWRQRRGRVEEVHRISRQEAEYRNTHHGRGRSAPRDRHADFYGRLYRWSPVLAT